MGELRFVAPMSCGQRRLTPAVTRFALMYPKVQIRLRLGDGETDVVGEGIDLVLRIAYPTDSSFVVRPTAPVPRYLCAAQGCCPGSTGQAREMALVDSHHE